MMEWLQNNWFECVGALFALAYLLLEVKQNWVMWIIGIISSLFYVFIFLEAKLYAEMGMNGYYVIMSFYGLYCWKFRKKEGGEELSLSRINLRTALIVGAISLALFGSLSWMLATCTDSPVPIPDALVASLSIVATWLVAKKIVDHWYLWIFVNFFSAGLYYYQHLYPSSVLYIIYGVMSVVGLIGWAKSEKKLKNKENEDN